MLYLTCTTISSIDLAQYEVALAKDRVSVECGTMFIYTLHKLRFQKRLSLSYECLGR